MNWDRLSDFAAMGGHGVYVWGAYAMALAAWGWEAVMLVQRRRRALEELRDAAALQPHSATETSAPLRE